MHTWLLILSKKSLGATSGQRSKHLQPTMNASLSDIWCLTSILWMSVSLYFGFNYSPTLALIECSLISTRKIRFGAHSICIKTSRNWSVIYFSHILPANRVRLIFLISDMSRAASPGTFLSAQHLLPYKEISARWKQFFDVHWIINCLTARYKLTSTFVGSIRAWFKGRIACHSTIISWYLQIFFALLNVIRKFVNVKQHFTKTTFRW